MTRYFAQNTPRAGLEHMMMSVPGFQKRGGGMMILSRFCYKPEDVDCRYCLHYRRRSCQVRTCPYIAERLKSGAIEYLDLILEYFGHIPHAGLHKRIQAVEHWSGPDQAVLHTVSVHLRSRFADRVWDDAPPGYLAALYLLASKERLWQPALSALSHDSIDFSCIVSKPHGFAIQDYPIFYSARRLYDLKSPMEAEDLAHPKLVSDLDFHNIIYATMIARYVALCGTAEHAMLWMLEKNPNLRKAILCLDHDAAGIEAAGRLSDILREHGYSQIASLQSEHKDWDEDLKAWNGLEAQPAEEHPQFAVAGLVCRRIGARCKEVQPDRAVYQFPGLLLRYRNDLHWGRFDQAMERMETMAALALSVVLRECKQMGTALTTEQGVRFLESHILPHQNRGILKNRADEIAMQFQSVLAKNNCQGIRTQAEKKEVASAWLELAISCAKVPVKYEADEIKRRQKEEKTQREAEPVMA